MESYQTYQQSLLQQIEADNGKPVSPALRQAFIDCPRHEFISHYLHPATREWYEVNPQNLEEHLPTLYANRSLGIYEQTDPPLAATISQPSLVLNMLDLLDIQPAARVFEIGTGSGWNAGLMGKLVGPQGHVYSMEILDDLVMGSRQALQNVGVDSVTVLSGDGAAGYAPGAPFDRIVFTAGAYDIPLAIHQQLKEGGLLLTVLKIPGGGDDLVLLKKQNGVLISQFSVPVYFVPMQGQYRSLWLDGVDLTSFLEQEQIDSEVVGRMPFWWGSRITWNMMERNEGIRSFLYISEPGYRVFTNPSPQTPYLFGLYDEPSRSLVVAQDDALVSYGSLGAQNKLLVSLSNWVQLGMPGSVRLSLQIYSKLDGQSIPQSGWVLERKDSVFVRQLATS